MTNKTTKKDNFTAIVAVLKAHGEDELASVMLHEIELLERKAEKRSDKPTERQKENAEIKTDLLSKMTYGMWYSCPELQQMNASLAEGAGTQRTARLMNDLVAAGLAQKKIEKKVVYFALAE